MAHKHDSCTAYGWGVVCTSGQLSGWCTYEDCNNEYCSDLGHCECLCHSGKTCWCGHTWPKMEKAVHVAEPVAVVTDPVEAPVTEPARPEPPYVWAAQVAKYIWEGRSWPRQ